MIETIDEIYRESPKGIIAGSAAMVVGSLLVGITVIIALMTQAQQTGPLSRVGLLICAAGMILACWSAVFEPDPSEGPQPVRTDRTDSADDGE